MDTPLIGIACGMDSKDVKARTAYVDAVLRAGGAPLLLPPPAPGSDLGGLVRRYVELCDGVVLTGGRDPVMEGYGVPTHASADREDPRRQAFDEALIDALAETASGTPVLGVCLGMQMMALRAGGALDQHMPETTPTHADHMDDRVHAIHVAVDGTPVVDGQVTSWHRQSVSGAGSLRVVARAHDGVIEAIDDPSRAFYLGVQWHPERTSGGKSDANGLDLFRALVACASENAGTLRP